MLLKHSLKFKFCILLLISFSFSQSDSRLKLRKADILENITVDGVAMQYLKGNVVFQKGDMIMQCDWARFNKRTEQGFLFGNVSMKEGAQNLTCDSLFVDSPNDFLTAYSNAQVWDTTYSLSADTLFYFSKIDSGSANGNANLKQDNQTISGQKIEYKEFPESKGVSYAARGRVSILEQGRLATCGEAIYDRENGKTTLRINPEITDNGQIISGSEIFLEYDDCLLYTSPSPRDRQKSRMPSSA